MTRAALALMLCLIAACSADPRSPAPGMATGRWLTASGNLEVEIAPCGDALCGTVVRVFAVNAMAPEDTQKPAADPNSVLGLKILRDFAATSAGEWSGTIYNRDNGKIYDCLMTVLAANQLKIRPYVVFPLFGQTQIWTRK